MPNLNGWVPDKDAALRLARRWAERNPSTAQEVLAHLRAAASDELARAQAHGRLSQGVTEIERIRDRAE